MSKVFGGSGSESESYNKSYDDLNTAFSPVFGQTAEGVQGLSALLGGDSSGFDSYKDAVGFDAASEYGSRGITNNAAARGLLRSGSTAKSLQGYGDMIQNQFAQQYMDKLLGQAGIGLGAGQLVSGAGNVQESSSSKKPGLGGFLGKIATGVATGGASTAMGM